MELKIYRYRNLLQWKDQSIDYYLPATAKLQDIRTCSSVLVSDRTGSSYLFQGKCDQRYTGTFLCETSTLATATPTLSTIPLPAVTRDLHAVRVTVCPLAHLTHQFLACDVKTQCWAEMYGTSYSCGVSLTPLPPMMTCSNGVLRVPYTFVCDHHPDCDDNSDEEFCVFPQCQLSESFDCQNQEVG